MKKALLFLFLGASLYAQDVSDLDKALREAKKKQESATDKSSAPNEKKKAKPTEKYVSKEVPPPLQIPPYRLGVSPIFKPDEIAQFLNKGQQKDKWFVGKVTVLGGGIQGGKSELLYGVPAGALTGMAMQSLFLGGSTYKPTAYFLGWSFKDSLMPAIPEKSVLIFSKEKPAHIYKVFQATSDQIGIQLMMITPPLLE
jgi:hypothetical protein